MGGVSRGTGLGTALGQAAERLGRHDEEELFIAVGEGALKASAVAVAAFPGLEEKVRKDEGRRPMEVEKAKLYVKGSDLTPGVALHFANCCSPIPGDRIIGVQIPGKGVVIHTIDCDQLAALEDDESITWVDLAWTTTALKRTLAASRIIATVENKRGVLGDRRGVLGLRRSMSLARRVASGPRSPKSWHVKEPT